MRDGATIQLLALSGLNPKIQTQKSSKTMVVYLVRSFGLMPESVSHDWHVQPSCQRPNRGPPRRREFSPGELARVRIRLSSKPYKHTVRCKSRQSSLPTEFPDDFHIENSEVREQESCQRQPKSRFLTIQPFGMTNFLV
jgi:hypothetical protein